MAEISSYLQQWERVKRWYTRLHEISRGRVHLNNTEFSHDEVYAFFLNCYHLKDWIKHDPNSAPLNEHVEDYINTMPALAICADLCNGLKHLRLDSSRSGKNPKFSNKEYDLNISSDNTSIAIKYNIIAGEETYDALSLAQQCLIDWENYFSKYKRPT